VQAEINDDIAASNHQTNIVALINLTDDFETGQMARAGNQRLTHAAFRASNDYSRHILFTAEAPSFKEFSLRLHVTTVKIISTLRRSLKFS
jgi:hypothetical protein